MASDLSSNVMSALSALAEDYEASKAAGSAKRPPDGKWANLVKSMRIETDGVEVFIGNDVKAPGLAVSFTYSMFGNDYPIPTPGWAQGDEWPGKVWLIPLRGIKSLPSDTPAGKLTSFRIALENIKGSIQAILGDAFQDNLVADLQAAQAAVQAGGVVAMVRQRGSQPAKGKDRAYPEDLIVERLS